jgi:hypothetical protein
MSDDSKLLVVVPEANPEPTVGPEYAQDTLGNIRAIQVETEADYRDGAIVMKRLKEKREFFKGEHQKSIRRAKEAHEEALALWRRFDAPLAEAYDIVKAKCEEWQRKLLAERKRQEDERRLQMSIPVMANRAAEVLNAEFDKAVGAGDTAKAAHLLNQASLPAPTLAAMIPTPPPPAPVATAPPKIAGVYSATTWTFDITDESQVPREYLMLDLKKIGAVVRAMKDKTSIAGITARPESGMRVRS